MTLYSRVNLSTFVGGQPGDLPASLVGLADQSLADLSAAIKPVPKEFAGSGYWPVVEADVSAPTLDRLGRRYLVPRPPAPQPAVPSSVTMRQAKLMLHRAGLLADIETKISTMPGDSGEEARIEWASGSVLERDHPLVAVMGVPDDQVDSLFVWASAI